MAWRVNKGNASVITVHQVSADVLRNTPAFSADVIDANNAVQKRSLAVIDVPKKRDDGRTFLQIGRRIGRLLQLGKDLLLQVCRRNNYQIQTQL